MLVNDMSFFDNISDDEFINTVFSFQISGSEIANIEKEYSYKNKSTMKKLQQAVDKAFTKKMSEPRIVYEWTIDDYKRMDVNLVEF